MLQSIKIAIDVDEKEFQYFEIIDLEEWANRQGEGGRWFAVDQLVQHIVVEFNLHKLALESSLQGNQHVARLVHALAAEPDGNEHQIEDEQLEATEQAGDASMYEVGLAFEQKSIEAEHIDRQQDQVIEK